MNFDVAAGLFRALLERQLEQMWPDRLDACWRPRLMGFDSSAMMMELVGWLPIVAVELRGGNVNVTRKLKS
jgi:hypothetical protein